MRETRPISWIKAARKDFLDYPESVKRDALRALTIAAEGGMAGVAKPMHGLGSGVLEIALRHRGDAFRLIYALRIGEELWVVHAFQKNHLRRQDAEGGYQPRDRQAQAP